MIKPISSFPVFIVASLSEAKSFYTSNLGFSVAFENEWYIHLVSESGVQVGFMLPNQPTQPEIFHKQHTGDGVIFSLEVDNADSAYLIARESGLDIVQDLKSEDWGQHHFVVKDPNGVFIDIVQSFEPTEEYQSGYVAE